MIFVCWIFCIFFIFTECSASIDCSRATSRPQTTSMKLKQDLLCGLDKYVRPVQHHLNKTTVGIILAPRVIEFDDAESTLRLKTWLSMNWKDYQLAWDKLEYDSIDQLILDTSMVWVPDLSVYNTMAGNDMNLDQAVSPILVDYHGEVYSFMSPEMAGHCIPNWANWPYDVHVCTITLGSKRYLGSTVDFRFINDQKGVYLKYLLPSKDWEVINISTARNETRLEPKNETDSLFLVSLNYQFTVRRHASVYIASYLIPGLVMVIMSLGILWLPSSCVERVAIVCTLVVTQCIYLQFLAYKIPSNGDTTPYLVCFYRDCLALTGLLLVETIVTRSMISWNSDPSYLHTTFQFVASNRALQYIFMNDLDPKNSAKLMETGNEEGATLVKSDNNSQQWCIFVSLINRLFFIILLPVYLLLSVSLLPLNYSFSPN